MSDRMTELDLVVGSMFTTRPEEDRDLFEDEREWLSDIQDLLREEGVEVDLLSRPGVEIWEGGIDRFMDLYQLRQIAAYLEQDRDIAPLLKAGPPSDGDPDPLLVAIWDGEQPTRFPHLINHQADGGYYLPVDFAEPIWLEAEDDEPAEDERDTRTMSHSSALALRLASSASWSSWLACSSKPASHRRARSPAACRSCAPPPIRASPTSCRLSSGEIANCRLHIAN